MQKTMTRNDSFTQTRTHVKEQADSLRRVGKTEQEIVSWLEVTFNREAKLFESFESVSDLAEHVQIPSWKFYIS